MAEKIPYLKVFLSSPGDVNEERKIAIEVIEGLPYRPALRDRVAFRVIAWDRVGGDTPMLASLTPQEAINQGLPRPSECDITLSIFWQRMGTPFTDTDGKAYESGTHWELLDALKNPACFTLIFRRTEEVLFKVEDLKGQDQYRRVKTFFQSNLFYDGERILRGVNVYEKPEDFRQKLSTYLEAVTLKILKQIEGRIEEPPPPPSRNITEVKPQLWVGSPFPGLRSFRPADAPIFFGRGYETDQLVRQVAKSRLVAVVGASGSGKSSLVGAGLLPRLAANAISGEHLGSKDWKILSFTPAKNPFEGLYEAMLTAFPQFKPNRLEAHRVKTNFLQDMREVPESFIGMCVDGLENAPAWAEVLLFVDQFEELFTTSDPADQASFARLLQAIATSERVRAVLTMRHDFFNKAVENQVLSELLRGDAVFSLSIPRRDALREMIERPAERANLQLEAGLVERILDDTGDEPGNLALMAYALDELYKLDDDRLLTHAEYEQLGGVQGAIGTRAENEFKALKADESTIQEVFHALVEVDERGIATRRRADFQPETVPTAVRDLIYGFADARLLTTNYDPDTKTATVEVAHEAILREWKRLADWIEATQDDHRAISRMKRGAQVWHERIQKALEDARQGTGNPITEEAVKKRFDHLRPNAETLKEFTEACQHLGVKITDPILADFTEPEQERLYRELEVMTTSHQRRYDIGERLARIGDYRRGIGLLENGLPDIEWLPVAQGGEIQIGDKTFQVAPFFIAKYLITFPQFQAFVTSGEYDDLRWWQDFPKEHQPQSIRNVVNGNINAPRDSVSWYQAVAYSRWLNHHFQGLELGGVLRVGGNAQIRLPLEWEWQWAAQNGREGRKYPWGELDQYPRANTTEAGIANRSTAVGMYPQGVAACGALDMSGNLYEWCLNYKDNPESINTATNSKLLRGGAFDDSMNRAASAYRDDHLSYPYFNYPSYGLRLLCSSPIKIGKGA